MQVLKLRPYDHPVYTTKHNNHWVILKTPLIRPPRLILRPGVYDPTAVALTLVHLHLHTLMLSPSALYFVIILTPQRADHHNAYCTHVQHKNKNVLCKNNLRAAMNTLFNIVDVKKLHYTPVWITFHWICLSNKINSSVEKACYTFDFSLADC